MPKAANLKKGNVVSINNQPYQVQHIDVQTPSARGANTLYKIRFQEATTKQKLEQTFKGNDMFDEMELQRRPVTFLYEDKGFFTFMDSDNYDQYTLSEEQLEGRVEWLIDGLEGIYALLLDGQVVGVDLPQSVDLEIEDTAPAIKGATAASRSKSATLTNGAVVQVPEYMASGEIVRVNTETGKFISRAKG